MNKLVQCIFIRGDLLWPPGALVAQACHASSAVNYLDHNHPNTQSVFGNKNLITMEVFKVPTDSALESLSQTLIDLEVDHKLWTEQPENIKTCLCTKIYPETFVKVSEWLNISKIKAEKVV
uniref:peptidyl-tRNA hydrolase n=1 Tax=Phlebotomus papatasi TaxID=29031 RepID=A0A1B0D7K3_PHLPP